MDMMFMFIKMKKQTEPNYQNKVELLSLILAKKWTSGKEINVSSDIIKALKVLKNENQTKT